MNKRRLYREVAERLEAAGCGKLAEDLERVMGGAQTTEYTEQIYRDIEAAMVVGLRELRRGVLPRDVQARLPYPRAEGSVRRDMGAMARLGRLVRMVGEGCRQGYRLPTRMERICFQLSGRYPVGAEDVSPEAVKIAIRRER